MKSKKENIQLRDCQKKAIDVIVKDNSIYLSFPEGMGKSLNAKQEKKSKNREAR